MFDKVEEILVTLKERLTSPLFSSFIISWLIINWKITIGLIWFNNQQLIAAGDKTYIELVSKNIEVWHVLYYPLIVAGCYTFIYPLIRNCINAFLGWTNTWGEDWVLGIQKSGSMPVERFMELRTAYKERTKQATEVIEEASQSILSLSNLQTQYNDALTEINKLKREALENNKRSDYSIINGIWERESENEKEIVSFDNSTYQIIDDKRVGRIVANIRDFNYDFPHSRIFFVKEYTDDYIRETGLPKTLICRLITSVKFEAMNGTEGEHIVVYRRMP